MTAIAAVWAAVATTWAAIATSRAVIATRKPPIDAARLAASLQENSERRRTKLWVFGTIMQNRQFLAEVDCVRALNLVEAVFHDAPEVRDSWAKYSQLSTTKGIFHQQAPCPLSTTDERNSSKAWRRNWA
jgi:hypothetical protein